MDPSPSPDLNLFPVPKLEPKAEPPSSAITVVSPQNPNPNPRSPFPEVHTPLQELPPESSDEEALFAEYIRLARLYLASLRPSSAVAPANSGTIVANSDKKRKARSAEMVRVSSLTMPDHVYFRSLVRRTRMTYESLRAVLVRDDDRAERRGSGKRGRADLKAAALMADRGLWLNRDRRIVGAIPGIAIGDVFFFRMELCVIGLHGQVQAGIDFVTSGRSASGEPIATSVIMSGGYEDDDDGGDVVVYTGHGGREPNNVRHSVSQKLQGGNLALERSMNYGVEIRVVRGIKFDGSPTGRVYVYDGLYRIVEYWLDAGKSGFGVYKYKLVRNEGQEEMGSAVLRLAEDLKGNPLSVRPIGYLSLDISMGKENFPVSLFNDIDEDRDPLLYEYLARPIYPSSVYQDRAHLHGGGGCRCLSNCSVDCDCARRNGGEFPYDGNGILLRGKPLIYECGFLCHCPPSCSNRVSQKDVKHRLEIFRSRETGWGVRSLDLIRAGIFICEFSGIVLTEQQSEVASMNGDCLINPYRFPGRWKEWGDVSSVFLDYMPPDFPVIPELRFSIDVSRARNVACYLSHSCSPNVFMQFVLFDHYNLSYPHLMIFALENIPPMRELSIDYGVMDEYVGRLTL